MKNSGTKKWIATLVWVSCVGSELTRWSLAQASSYEKASLGMKALREETRIANSLREGFLKYQSQGAQAFASWRLSQSDVAEMNRRLALRPALASVTESGGIYTFVHSGREVTLVILNRKDGRFLIDGKHFQYDVNASFVSNLDRLQKEFSATSNLAASGPQWSQWIQEQLGISPAHATNPWVLGLSIAAAVALATAFIVIPNIKRNQQIEENEENINNLEDRVKELENKNNGGGHDNGDGGGDGDIRIEEKSAPRARAS